MKKKLLLTLLSMLTLFALFALPAAAADTYGLWVGGVQVTSDNAADVLGDADGDAKTVLYDPAANTLTLNGATIKAAIPNGVFTDPADAYAVGIYAAGDLNLSLIGTNTFTPDDGIGDLAIDVYGALTIRGGTLLTKDRWGSIISGGDITITGSVIDVDEVNTDNLLKINSTSHVRTVRGVMAKVDIAFEDGVVNTGGGFVPASDEKEKVGEYGYQPTSFEYLGIDHLDCQPEINPASPPCGTASATRRAVRFSVIFRARGYCRFTASFPSILQIRMNRPRSTTANHAQAAMSCFIPLRSKLRTVWFLRQIRT